MKLTKKQIIQNKKAIQKAIKQSQRSKKAKQVYLWQKFWNEFTASSNHNNLIFTPLINLENLPSNAGVFVSNKAFISSKYKT